MPKMTTLGITKEEMIYQFIISLNKNSLQYDTSDEIVCKAINEYDKLIEKDIIKEIAYVEPGEPTDDPHVLKCKTARGCKSTNDFDANLAIYPSTNESRI